METTIIKVRARYERKTVNGDSRFGYCSSVIYDIKIAQTGSTLRVKHIDDETRDNILTYKNLGELLDTWTIFKKY